MASKIHLKEFKKLYVKGKKIGQGSFGRVYLGNAVDSDEKLAIKEYRKVNDKELNHMWTEYSILKKFSKNGCQKGILCADDLFIDVDTKYVYLITKYLDGGTLKTIKGNCEIIYEVAEKLLLATSIVHKGGIIHGDIKPDNIMMKDGDPVIIDFGLSCFARNKDCTYRGSLMYMAPELFNSGFVSKKSDIWSLGISLYELCQGDPYPMAETSAELKKVIADKNTKIVSNSQFEPLNILVNSMLVFDEKKRPSANKLLKQFKK